GPGNLGRHHGNGARLEGTSGFDLAEQAGGALRAATRPERDVDARQTDRARVGGRFRGRRVQLPGGQGHRAGRGVQRDVIAKDGQIPARGIYVVAERDAGARSVADAEEPRVQIHDLIIEVQGAAVGGNEARNRDLLPEEGDIATGRIDRSGDK